MMTCGGGINAIKRNEPPKTETHTWPSALLAYGMVLPELPSFKELTREVERSVFSKETRRLYQGKGIVISVDRDLKAIHNAEVNKWRPGRLS